MKISTEIYRVNLRIHSKYGKIRTRKTPNELCKHRFPYIRKTAENQMFSGDIQKLLPDVFCERSYSEKVPKIYRKSSVSEKDAISQSLFFNKVAGLQPAILFIKRF